MRHSVGLYVERAQYEKGLRDLLKTHRTPTKNGYYIAVQTLSRPN